MTICFISSDYPESGRPVFTFVKNLVDAIANLGNKCIVIAPFSITKNKKFHKQHEVYKTPEGYQVEVYRPNYISVSNYSVFGVNISGYFHRKAVEMTLNTLKVKPDVIYGHFWVSAYEGYNYARKNNIPLVVASGESVIPQSIVNRKFSDFYDYVSGVICVSTKNKEESIAKGLTMENKCIVIPNAIDNTIFKKIDKSKCRLSLGIPNNDFVVISTGSYIHRKGIKRISDAIDLINEKVSSIFIGSGPEEPTCNNIIFKGRVNNKDLPLYLNAADVFVLPTLNEGCCNAIIEAMACGLPIISSDKSFNWDILNENNSIMIDPMDIQHIADSILLLKSDNNIRTKLSEGALNTSSSLTIDKRAERILNYIKTKIKEHGKL